jgi:hypothetical protein
MIQPGDLEVYSILMWIESMSYADNLYTSRFRFITVDNKFVITGLYTKTGRLKTDDYQTC